MLGSVESANDWHWAAWGKHPVAKDYFTLGLSAPLLKAFSEWVEKGYKILSSKQRPSCHLCSWRFWARGPKRETLVCGIGRESSDSFGRPYPLLIMGAGPLKGWEDHWDLLPLACEKTWLQIEYMSARRYLDFRQFEDEVRLIRPPYPLWSEFSSQREHSQKGLPWNAADMEKKVSGAPNKAEFLVSLDGGGFDDPFALAGLWHAFLKARIGGVPNAVFMGGTPDETHLAVFRRALAPADFVRLWSELGATSNCVTEPSFRKE